MKPNENEIEELNYTDLVYLIEAFTYYLGSKEGKIGTYRLELLGKLERNRVKLYNMDKPQLLDECQMELEV